MTMFSGVFSYSKSARLPREGIKHFQEFFDYIKTEKKLH